MNLIRKIIITGLGSGYLPAPGTWGSLGPVLIYYVLHFFLIRMDTSRHDQFLMLNIVFAGLALLSSIACVALGRAAEQIFGKKDPQKCTIDEWAGQSVALLFLPLGHFWTAPAVAFVAFRFFDILKPPPARQMEKLPAGWGVLLDDIVAGIYANIAAQLILRLGIF